MNNEKDIFPMIEELLRIQARIICLESLYTKFVNIITVTSDDTELVEASVAIMLRDERRKLTSALNDWIGRLS